MKELLLISGLGVLALAAGLFNLRKPMLPIVLLGLLANIGFCIADWGTNESVYNMLLLDNFALAFTMVLSLVAILWFVSASDYFQDDNNFSDHYALVLFMLTGGFLLVSFTNMVMLFLGIEILSIPLFVLVGSNKTKIKSNEAAFKYFLLGSFASAFLLFGITLIYGSTGSFNTAAISSFIQNSSTVSPLLFAGMLLMLASMSFKVSAAPFHFWAPDVYQGAPTNITALMATVVKTVAFAAFYRLFYSAFPHMQKEYQFVFAIIAAATLIISNVTAAVQTNAKRMLAYSSISHAGFMMVTVLTMKSNSANILLYYTLVYSIASIAAFNVFKTVKANSNGNEDINVFKGLVKRNPLMAGTMTLALLSMAGIPPLAGFIAKYLVFTSAVANGYIWLVVIAIITSLIGVYYYFKIIIPMFGEGNAEDGKIEIGFSQKILLMICSLGMLLLSVFPDIILNLL
ncbi:MAG: NADH-quinone oxidoreductase subunit N [bacterium]|nr:NADH-quinone oxidoreductase subunit N [bacterium]